MDDIKKILEYLKDKRGFDFSGYRSLMLKRRIQKRVSDISNAMLGMSNLKEFGIEILKILMEMTDSNMSAFYVLNENKNEFEHFTSVGTNEELFHSFNAKNPEGVFDIAVSGKKIYHVKNIPEDTIFKYRMIAGDTIPKEIITIPILVEREVFAVISLASLNKYSMESLESLNQAWTNINTSYSNLLASVQTKKLAEELQDKNMELQNQVEELQVQAEELQQKSEELQAQNLELDMQRTQVEEANRLQSEFLSNMSHELRTPLNSVLALSKVLIDQSSDKLSTDEINYLNVIERNGRQLLDLINDFLDLSKIESGRVDIEPTIPDTSSPRPSVDRKTGRTAGNKILLVDEMKVETDIKSKKMRAARRGSKKVKPKILLVEDDNDSRLTIKAVLHDRYQVMEAADGEEGLKKTTEDLPDLVILDISLPKMDGLTVAKKIKTQKKTRDIPVIAFTAHVMEGDKERIIAAGCDDYLEKPADVKAILRKIEKWSKPCQKYS